MTTATLKHVNGATHALPPLAPVPLIGPARPWPRTAIPVPPPGARLLPIVAPDREVAPPPAPAKPLRVPRRLRLPAVNGDALITVAMAATVAVVAVDAAIISYSHIYDLATGQQGTGTETGVQPVLLPLSIDGVIAEASLVMLYAARHKIPASGLARFMLWLGITATVAANVAHGLPASVLSPLIHDVIGALLSAWPAGAFIGSMEMAMRLVRDVRAVADGDTLPRPRRASWRRRRRERQAALADTAETPPPADPPPAKPAPASRRPGRHPRKTPARQPRTGGSKLTAAKALLAAKPAMTVPDLIAAGVSEGTARRAKKEQASP